MRWNDARRYLKLSPIARKRLSVIAIVLVVAYVAFGSLVWWAMNQPPETFGRVMKRMPGPIPFLLFPFETAWLHARAGSLHVGDAAPDFTLPQARQIRAGSTFRFEQTATGRIGLWQLHLTTIPAGGSCPQQAL